MIQRRLLCTGLCSGLFILSSCSVLTTGCFFMPSKEISHEIIIETEPTFEYELVEAVRGDVVSSQTVYCIYSETIACDLSFSTGGLTVRYVYVSEGDTVKEGDLLAKLDTSNLDAQYANYSYTIEKTQLDLAHTKELLNFDLAALDTRYQAGELSDKEYANSVESTKNYYQATIDSYNETLYIDELRLQQIEEQLAGAAIYAPMTGTISYVTQNLEGSRVTVGTTAISIVDASQCAFAMEDHSYASYFTEGQELTLADTKGNTYDATVMVKEGSDGSLTTFFVLIDPSLAIPVGTRASYTLVYEEAKDVLMVPYVTVHHANDQYFVYMQNENGIKTLQYVTIGLKGNTYIEITGGLSEGDYIIKK